MRNAELIDDQVIDGDKCNNPINRRIIRYHMAKSIRHRMGLCMQGPEGGDNLQTPVFLASDCCQTSPVDKSVPVPSPNILYLSAPVTTKIEMKL